MYIKPLIVLFVAVILCCGSVLGQDTADRRVNALVAGAKALQFEIDSDFDLGSFQGSIISYKIQTSPGSATRIGLSLSGSVDDDDRTSLRNDGAFNNSDQNQSLLSIGIAAQRLFYSQPARRVSFFWGLGPTVSFFKSDRDTESRISSPGGLPPIQTRVGNNDLTRWNAGASAVAGVEFFLSKSISLLAEYGATLQYSWFKTTSKNEVFIDGVFSTGTEDERVDKGLSFFGQRVKFGVSVYFGM